MGALLNRLTKTAETWNGAVSYSSTGLDKYGACLDYFSKCGTYTKRTQEAVNADMAKIFSDDEKVALSIIFALRLISRKPNVEGIEEVQTGYGRRDEFYKACVWLHNNHPELLYSNLHLIPVFGSWKDFLQSPLIETLDRNKVYQLFSENLDDQLLLKYLPQIRGGKRLRSERDKLRSAWAKGFANFVGWTYKNYRQVKSGGNAHIWQKQMSHNEWDKVNFNGIPGKAMLRHTTQKNKSDNLTVFERHNQVARLRDWVLGQKTVKFTGYPYELTAKATSPSLVQKMILDKQFESVLEPMKGHNLGNVLACLDISGSMTWASGMPAGVTPYDICISMGITFSCLNTGYFKDVVCGFSDRSILLRLAGGMCDRLNQIRTDRQFQQVAWGSTNFQGVIDLLVQTRQAHPEIPVEEYPETILVISDMQFNPVGGNAETNYEAATRKLKSVGLNETRLIWWFVSGQGSDFPCTMDSKGCYIIGGFDPVNLKALMGLSTTDKKNKDFNAKEKQQETPLDGMMNVLSQPIFGLLT